MDPNIQFYKVVIDCHSVGYAASELHSEKHPKRFQARSIILCIISLVKIYLLAAFDPDIFRRLSGEDKKAAFLYSAEIFASTSAEGKNILTKFCDAANNLKPQDNDACQECCKQLQKVILRQDVTFSLDKPRLYLDLWTRLKLPPILLYCKPDDLDEDRSLATLKTQTKFVSETLIVWITRPKRNMKIKQTSQNSESQENQPFTKKNAKIPKFSLQLNSSNQENQAIALNELAELAENNTNQEFKSNLSNPEGQASTSTECREAVLTISNLPGSKEFMTDTNYVERSRIPFAVTKDGAYFYVPKDYKGSGKNTLMQDLINLELSTELSKSFKKKNRN